MKALIMVLVLAGPFSLAMAKNCKEDVLGAALQAEAMRADATGFSTPVDAVVVSSHGSDVTWIATIVGNDGQEVSYSVLADNSTCEILEEPIRSR
jgi:acyl-homoserine lactone acylase PvdQ